MMKDKNDNKSFIEAVKISSSYIYSLSYRLTGSPEDAEDLMQETYLKAYNKWLQLHNTDNPIPWLRKICLNIFIDNNKKSSTKLKIKETNFPEQYHDIVSNMLTPEQEFLLDEETEIIKSQCYSILCTSLHLYQRIAFVLIDIFQLSIHEVSVLIDKSYSATKSLLYRAREKMNTYLLTNCSLVNSNNICKCKSWTDLADDIQKKRELMRTIIKSESNENTSTSKNRKKLNLLIKNLPYLNPPKKSIPKTISKLKNIK